MPLCKSDFIYRDTGQMSYLSRGTPEPVVVSFYTVGTPYQLEVLNLIESCQSLEIEHQIEGIESRGSWELNCAFKPFFIQEKLLSLKRPVFWVDADAVFLKKPSFENYAASDLAVRFMDRFAHDPRFRLNAAAMYINYTPQAVQIVKKWCALCSEVLEKREKSLEFLDQTSLLDALEEAKETIVLPLPVGYCKVFDLDETSVAPQDVVIEQRQASRRFRSWWA